MSSISPIVDKAFYECALRRFEAREAAAENSLVKCDSCGLMCDPADTESLGGRVLCDKCADAYYSGEAFLRFGEAYIKKSTLRYMDKRFPLEDDSSEFFGNWWASGLSHEDRARILLDAFGREKQAMGPGYFKGDEKNFCTQSDDWREFVQSQLERC